VPLTFTIEPKVTLSYSAAKDVANIIKSAAELVDELAFTVTPESFKLVALDPSKIAMLIVELPPESFRDYKVPENLTIGVSASSILNILKHIKKSDVITIGANDEFVEIIVEGGLPRRYKTRNIAVAVEEVPQLDVEFDVMASVTTNSLKSAISELSALTQTVGIKASGDELLMYDYESKKSRYRFTSSAGSLISLTIKNEADVPFDSDYLSRVAPILSLGSVADVSFGREAPLRIYVSFASGGSGTYYLASKA